MIANSRCRAGRPATSALRVVVLCWSSLSTQLAAQPPLAETPIEETIRELSYTMLETGEKIAYSLFVPSSYDGTEPSPLVVLLHGLDSSPEEVIRYEGVVSEAEKRGYLVVAPYGYNPYGGYGAMGPGKSFIPFLPGALGESAEERRRRVETRLEAAPENLGELSEKDVLNVLEIVRGSYSVDSNRIYLMGHSLGGAGALYLAMSYSRLWAAIAAMAPAIFRNPDGLGSMVHIPVIVVQGEQDRAVPVASTRRWIEKMEELGMTYRYLEIPGGDHVASIASNPAVIAEVFAFFDRHRRTTGAP